ncbi:MAG: twin-arginine translocase TatA/TatE family subunit [Lutibacter sp.]|uniref:Sec-independent protein translocase subunit TatA/TatB n=1 Tax=Lutibacter sp. TaxID=1925666 RepID=UPI001816E8B4|nr:twin-arginine translocase TatA/TatE family subunit [Lutibacter sp.]MBT8318225.1 twin-arginine translocase TatA/TatE family subunit [Lutibacter sp.]NNJ59084.1 twin-arginine translocase TatA/TatE family subunit [Lutibacter sp.]
MFLFISGAEIFVILLIVVMLFGADKLPEIARGLGKGMRQIKDATNDIKREIKNSADKNDIDIDAVKNIRKEISKVKDNFDDYTKPVSKVKDTIVDEITGPIKRNK